MRELEVGPLHRFRDWPNDHVPKRAAGVYTVWDGAGMDAEAATTIARLILNPVDPPESSS